MHIIHKKRPLSRWHTGVNKIMLNSVSCHVECWNRPFNMLNVVEQSWTKIETTSIPFSNLLQHRSPFVEQQMLQDLEPCATSLTCLSYTCSSLPSVTSMTIRPSLLRPVRPILCTRRIGDACASKQTIRSTSPMSRPSSPTHVATRVLYPPCRKRCTTFVENDEHHQRS